MSVASLCVGLVAGVVVGACALVYGWKVMLNVMWEDVR